ncbi:MAG TPA: TMEM175 family protein [Solirubrobacteraceae bacterium]|nr:TMEM175 family protein [Solirubrobacteraceae bacterium]
MSTARLEAFSDGVMAVAITLLVLNIAIPGTRHPLPHELGQQWPAYAAYTVSFITIGIIWINHHISLGRLARPDHSILMLNLLLLMTVVVIPFGTSLLAHYLRAGQGEHLAAGIYGGILLAMAVAFTALNAQILLRRPELLTTPLAPEVRRRIFLRSFSGVFPYVVATALAVVSPYATLGLSAALAAFYALPFAGGIVE